MMNEIFSFHPWLTVLILLFLFLLFVVIKITGSKRKITSWDFMTSAAQALFAGSAIIMGIDIICLWTLGELYLPHTLIEPVHPLLAVGFFLLAMGSWVIYENLRRFRKKR